MTSITWAAQDEESSAESDAREAETPHCTGFGWGAGMERARVLIVEDVSFIAMFMARFLERAGYETATVDRGDEALQVATRFRPHAVILDLELPGLPGLAVCRALRATPALEGIVVLIASAHTFEQELQEELASAGADGHFTKPVAPAALVERLESMGVGAIAPARPSEQAHGAYREALAALFLAASPEATVAVQDGEGWSCIHGRDSGPAPSVVIEATNERPAIRITLPHPTDAQIELARGLVQAADPVAGLAREREGLSRELEVAYQSLNTVYEIGKEPSLLADPERALAHILDRAIDFEPGVSGVIWRRTGSAVEPVQWRGTDEPPARPDDVGVTGWVMREMQARTWQGSLLDRDVEPELRAARRIAAAPLVSGDQAVGAMVLWHEQPGRFDSRLVGLMASLLSHAAMILEQARLRQESIEGARLRQEVALGGQIQETLLFGQVPPVLAGEQVGVVAESCREVGGDFFEVYAHEAGVFDVLIGDVMGKGLPAALMGAAVKSQFDRHAQTQRADGTAVRPVEPRRIVAAVHDAVARQLIDLSSFVTVLYARFNLRARTLTFVSCGHPTPLQRRGASTPLPELEYPGAVNLPLGFLADTRYEQIAVPFEASDEFLLYSDGATEATNPDGEMLDEAGLAALLDRAVSGDAQEMASSIRAAIVAFTAERVGDDLTLLLVRPAEAPGARQPASLEVPAVRGHLADVRSIVDRTCREHPLGAPPEELIEQLQVAVVEAASNVIRHAYEPNQAASLRIESAWTDEGVEFRILDRGRPFTLDAIPPRDPKKEGGGFGLVLMSQIADEVEFSRSECGRNCVLLRKKIAA